MELLVNYQLVTQYQNIYEEDYYSYNGSDGTVCYILR